MWPHPPALLRSCRRGCPVTDDPLPALTTMPSPWSRAAASPELRSLPVTIFAFGQISRQICLSALRSSAVAQPARKTPAQSICFGSSARIVRKRSGGREAKSSRPAVFLAPECEIPNRDHPDLSGLRFRPTPMRFSCRRLLLRGCAHRVSRLVTNLTVLPQRF